MYDTANGKMASLVTDAIRASPFPVGWSLNDCSALYIKPSYDGRYEISTLNMPGFSADTSLYQTRTNYRMFGDHSSLPGPRTVVPLVMAAFPRGGRFSTLPTCGNENCRTVIVYEQCGSAPVGEVPPMCPAGTTTECDYVCRWPSGIKGTM
jgi:hypothetical protein